MKKYSIRIKNVPDDACTIENIEIKDGFFGKPLCEMTATEAESVRDALAELSRKPVLCTVNMPVCKREEYKILMNNADIIGFEYIKLCLCPLANGYEDDDLRFLIDLVRKSGKRLLFEMRAKYTHFTFDTYARFRSDATGLIFNPMEFAADGLMPYSDVLVGCPYSDDIVFLRVNDGKDGGVPAQLFKGDAQIKECTEHLISNGFDGFFSFRAYMDGYPVSQLKSDFEASF